MALTVFYLVPSAPVCDNNPPPPLLSACQCLCHPLTLITWISQQSEKVQMLVSLHLTDENSEAWRNLPKVNGRVTGLNRGWGGFILFGPVNLKDEMFPALNRMFTWWIWPSLRSWVAQPAVQSLTWLENYPDQGWEKSGAWQGPDMPDPIRESCKAHDPWTPWARDFCFSVCQAFCS